VRYGETNRLRRLRRSEEAGNRNGKYSRHLKLIGCGALFR
jgi:hypothetical protein